MIKIRLDTDSFSVSQHFSLSTSQNQVLEVLPVEKKVDSLNQSTVPPLQCTEDLATSTDSHVSRRH